MQRRSWRVEILYGEPVPFRRNGSGKEMLRGPAIEAGPIVKIVKIVFGAGLGWARVVDSKLLLGGWNAWRNLSGENQQPPPPRS